MDSSEKAPMLDALLEKQTRLIGIAKNLIALSHEVADEFQKNVGAKSILTHSERISIALYKKMYFALIGLTEDVKKRHPVAMHHLKTLIECRLYIGWMHLGDSEKRAKFIEAKACNENIKFLNKNRERYGQDHTKYISEWTKRKQELIEGNEGEFKKFLGMNIGAISKEGEGLHSIYNAFYRYACQSAHIGDMHMYMPLPQSTSILSVPVKGVLFWNIVTMQQAIWTVLGTLEGILGDAAFQESTFKNKVFKEIEDLRSQYDSLTKA